LEKGVYQTRITIFTIDNPKIAFYPYEAPKYDIKWSIDKNGIVTAPEFPQSILAFGEISSILVAFFMLARRF